VSAAQGTIGPRMAWPNDEPEGIRVSRAVLRAGAGLIAPEYRQARDLCPPEYRQARDLCPPRSPGAGLMPPSRTVVASEVFARVSSRGGLPAQTQLRAA
jgi:hypothetical protein